MPFCSIIRTIILKEVTKMTEPLYILTKIARNEEPEEVARQNLETVKEAMTHFERIAIEATNAFNSLRQIANDFEQAPKDIVLGKYKLVLDNEKLIKPSLRINKNCTEISSNDKVIELKNDSLPCIMLRHLADSGVMGIGLHQDVLKDIFYDEKENIDGYDTKSVRNAMNRINKKTQEVFGVKLIGVKKDIFYIDCPIEKSK